jgi:hypothetical protein
MRSGANATQLRLILVSRVCRSVLFFLVAGVIAAPEHQECILATVMDDITRKSTSTPDARHRTYPEGHQTRPPAPTASDSAGGHGTRYSGPATIKLVSLPLPAA